MKFLPHDYQKYAIDFLVKQPIAALLLQMGLGKTIITLTALEQLLFDYFEIHKVLIIGPLRVSQTTWPDEIKKWDHLRNLKFSTVIGNEKQRIKALETKADIYITNRENIEWLVYKCNYLFDFDTVVIDELSSFKNYQSKRFKALMRVRPKVKRIVGLTGTPASNGFMDLFAEYKVLDMGARLGHFITAFRNQYFAPNKRNAQIIFSYKLLPGAEDAIFNKVRDITISMKALDHIKMPELITTNVMVKMNDCEMKAYISLKKELVLDFKDEKITASNAATLTSKLLQLASGALYTETKATVNIHDRKLDALEDLIEAANGQSVLVAYWFQHDLDRIEQRLKSLNINFQKIDTKESIELWNAKKLQVGLIHPASAGHGLNLQSGSSTLIWFSLTWSLELYQQTVARLYRQGQLEKTVVVEHILTEGTIDERILATINAKDKTQNTLLDAVKADLKGIYHENI